MKYFFDNCISYRYARMLAALEQWEEIVALRDRFDQNIGDVELFSELKGSGFVFVTFDDKQRTRMREATALREAGLTSLWFGPFWAKKSFMDQAKWIITRWPTIDGYVAGCVKGTCAEIRENGKAMAFTL